MFVGGVWTGDFLGKAGLVERRMNLRVFSPPVIGVALLPPVAKIGGRNFPPDFKKFQESIEQSQIRDPYKQL